MSWPLRVRQRIVLFWSSCGRRGSFTTACGWGCTSTLTVRICVTLSWPSNDHSPPQSHFIKLWPLLLADSLAWVDGSPMDYTNWPNKVPDSKLLTADSCVTTRVVDGVWHLSRCTERLGFVCKTTSRKLKQGPSERILRPLYWPHTTYWNICWPSLSVSDMSMLCCPLVSAATQWTLQI